MSDISEKEAKKLCMKSGRFCVICHVDLIIYDPATKKETVISYYAHIKGKKPGAARYDAAMTDEERNAVENLILLCGNCHKTVDDQPTTYTSDRLSKLKKDHEGWNKIRTSQGMNEVTFAELEVVTKFLKSGQATQSTEYLVVPPKDKIKKNGLSSKIEDLIKMGMTRAKQVEEFIEKSPDSEFGDRLKKGFVDEYERLRNGEGYLGDDLFNELNYFASAKSTGIREQAAGLAVLVHLFEKCEVFEK